MLENEVPIDYLLIDYLLDILYRDNRLATEVIDGMPYTNPNMHQLRLHFDDEFNEDKFQKMLSDTGIFKLTYKGKHAKYSSNRTPTFYGFVLDGTL